MNDIGLFALLGLLLYVIELAYFRIALTFRIIDLPHHQSSHKGAVVRGGGVIFYFAFLLWSLINGIPSMGGLLGLTVLAVVSIIDDIKSVNPLLRLFCQFVAILLLFYHSGLIRNPTHVVILLSISCVGALNIFNFMDGINGMTSGYTLVVAFALIYVNTYMVHFIDPNLLVIVLIAIVIFLYFNFRKQAVCFAGDVGSLSIGFIMVFLVLRLALKGQSMAWICFFSVYIVDGGMTILHRIFLREDLLKPHKKHVYQIMANELGMSHLIVSGIYMGLQAISCIVFIIWPGYPTFFIVFGALIVIYMLFMKKYYYLHERKTNV